MLSGWEKTYPGRVETIFHALANVSPSQLADQKLFNFKDLTIEIDKKSHFPELPVVQL